MKNTILITGTSTGIGRETAKLFQSKGWNVIATMRTPENEKKLQQLENVLVAKLDVLDIETIQNAISKGIERFGKIDVLVNNAGYSAYGALEAFSREQIVNQFNTNVIGLLDVTRTILPHFRQNKNGTIINISSVAGKASLPFGSLYSGTKFAVEGISEALNFEMSAFGGKIKIIEPGLTATGIMERSEAITNDEHLAEYQPLMKSLLNALDSLEETASPVNIVAKVIYEAATDETEQLRYVVGEDAEALIHARKISDDAAFISGIKAQFGI